MSLHPQIHTHPTPKLHRTSAEQRLYLPAQLKPLQLLDLHKLPDKRQHLVSIIPVQHHRVRLTNVLVLITGGFRPRVG